jgi:hypothetical protein
LKAALYQSYKEHRLVTLRTLARYHQRLYRKDHPQGCPGITALDFYGAGTNVFAVVLSTGAGQHQKHELILAEASPRGSWRLKSIETAQGGPAPVVWTEGPGNYKGVHDGKALTAKNAVIVFVGYESWAIVYSWMGTEIEKVWVSD